MDTNFQADLSGSGRFIITMELVPKAEPEGRSINTVLGFAKKAQADGRISAVSITDNPGGRPSLSPDMLGKEILNCGMDVIVHFTCRDMNRLGIESRALQLRRMGMKNILALTGDYTGKGFGGEGAPVFDIDSVLLLCQLSMLNHKTLPGTDSAPFFLGCAVSPFKWTEPESWTQYYKLCKKISSGASFVITQLGYDVRKFQELIQFFNAVSIKIPALASIYFLTPKSARVMNSGRIPGAVVRNVLFEKIKKEWEGNPRSGYFASVERTAKLAAICKGLGYRGVHICGVHRNFKTVERILDRIAEIEHNWQDFIEEFDDSRPDDYFMFARSSRSRLSNTKPLPQVEKTSGLDKFHFKSLNTMHDLFFRFDAPLSARYKSLCQWLDQHRFVYYLVKFMEDRLKKMLLSCRMCGDCGIQHAGFLCPESQCPKHIRNGVCGGSRNGYCEVHSDRHCVWYRVYRRLASVNRQEELSVGCVAPRMWELDGTSSWINFHLRRDHQSISSDITDSCSIQTCRISWNPPRPRS